MNSFLPWTEVNSLVAQEQFTSVMTFGSVYQSLTGVCTFCLVSTVKAHTCTHSNRRESVWAFFFQWLKEQRECFLHRSPQFAWPYATFWGCQIYQWTGGRPSFYRFSEEWLWSKCFSAKMMHFIHLCSSVAQTQRTGKGDWAGMCLAYLWRWQNWETVRVSSKLLITYDCK